MFDDPIQRQMAQQAAAKAAQTAQTAAAFDPLCRLLGQLRSGLIEHGLTTDAAEAIVIDYARTVLAAGSDQ